MINFGRYKHIIDLYIEKQIKDEFNSVSIELVKVTSKRSRVLNKSITTTNDNTPSTVIVIEARIRYSTDINSNMTLRFENIDYEITSVVDYDNSKRELIITAIKQ